MTAFVASSPGRINLIGEHTDYNNGFALPMALTERTTVRFVPDDSDSITLQSAQQGDGERFDLSAAPGDVHGWSAYPAGVVWALAAGGHRVVGGTMSISSDVPIGAGLSSSAALECAVLLAMTAATGVMMSRLDMAKCAQKAENEFVGAPTGLMDQLASLYGDDSHALLIDFDVSSVQPVVFQPAAHGLSLLVVNSHAAHQHSTGEYAARRQSCTRAAADLGVDSLRRLHDLPLSEVLPKIADDIDRRRARHILTENHRVLDCADALAAQDFVRVGELMTLSHASMRDDFGITTAHIDLIAESALTHGALGARMTGGGFGGCVIALVPSADSDRIAAEVAADVDRAGFAAPSSFVAR